MLRIGPAHTLPENFDCFVEELAPVVGGLYGVGAEREYRQQVRRGMSANIAHPAIQAFTAVDRGKTVGIVLAIDRPHVAEIGLLHVLASHLGKGVEARLIREAVAHLRARSCAGIVCESVPVDGVQLAPGFRELGFETVPRMIMAANIAPRALGTPTAGQAQPLGPAHWRPAAACLVDAYVDHPGRRLHAEVRDPEQARDYIARVAAGNYGPVLPGSLCAVMDAAQCRGMGLGCRIAPGAGFILQLAVRRDAQGQGVGGTLLAAITGSFRDSGLEIAYLGVTRDNPARAWYEHVGFTPHRDVDAHVWWRQDD